MSLPRYYAWLTRLQDASRLVGHDSGQDTLTVHRRLRAAGGEVSGDVLHGVILDALAATSDDATPVPLTVLDAGCGLGGTLLFLHARIGARGLGITLSPDQAARAMDASATRGAGDAVRFVVRDFDTPLDDLLPGGVDLVVAIESLAHAPDPAATIARLAGTIRPGGRMIVVDDAPSDGLTGNDVDLAGFRRGWHAPRILGDAALDRAIDAAGLTRVHDVDLTPRLVERPAISLATRLALARVAWPLAALTPAAVLHDAIAGGLHLERLYARGVARYRLVVARRLR
ncbi:MAG: methyltransferase domain-containing protein [Vicinamibacterales bacterium]